MSEEAKQKQIAVGNIPRESVVTYWFDMDTFAILKEEGSGYTSECEAAEVNGGGVGVTGTGCQETEIRTERIYENFQFDMNIPDSEFEIDPLYRRITVDASEKFD